MMHDTLLYPIADMLAMQVSEMKDGRVRGATTRMIGSGPWRVESEVMLVSDVIADKQASYFVRLMPTVWLYVVVTDAGNGSADMQLIAFNGKKLGLKFADASTFGGQSIQATIDKIAPARGESFEYRAKAPDWKPLHVPDLDAVPQA